MGAALHDLWGQQVYSLADDFRTITYDLRGVGSSDKPRSGYLLDRLADDLYELIGALRLANTTLVSHGIGGHVVLRCVARHPEVAIRIALCASAPWYRGNRAGEGGFSEEFSSYLNEGIARNNAELHWDLAERFYFHHDPSLAVKVAGLQMALSWPAYVWKLLERDLADVDHRPYLPTIAQRALILHGVHDRKNRYEGASILAKNLPNGELVSFESSAHCPFLEEPDRFNEILAKFVEQ